MSKKKFSLVDIELSQTTQSVVNLVANVLSFAVSLVISFFISPFIVKHLGVEANGFVTLSANFVSYANILKAALNSVGSRYIMMSYHKGDFEKANKYYSSLFYGDLFLGIVFSVISALCVWKLENLINIPNNLVKDVKIMFGIIFLNFIFNTITTIFSSAPYIKNKIYLQSIRDIQSSLVRAILLLVLFSFFAPNVYYTGLASLIPSMIVIMYNIYYKKKLVPELKVSRKNFSIATIKELVSQGIWNSVSQLGMLLCTGLDLLIANLYISETDMGILSVAKSMPNVISGLTSSLGSVFYAQMVLYYAKDDIEGLAKIVKRSSMIIGAIVTIPVAFLISYGTEFYSLWQPTLDAKQLQLLSILTALTFVFYAGGTNISNIFTITLHIKQNASAIILTGFASVVVTLLLLKYTNLGIIAIAGVSPVLTIIRTVFFNVTQAAKYIGKKKTEFAPVILRSVLGTVILSGLGYLLKHVLPSDSWVMLIISAVLFGIISLGLNMIIFMNKDSRKEFIAMVKTQLHISK